MSSISWNSPLTIRWPRSPRAEPAEIDAPRERTIAHLRQPAEQLGTHSLELRVEDEVDDARDGVRAVRRRGAARDDLDPLHEIARHQVDVDGADVGRRNHAPAVQQHQIALRTEVAQVQKIRAVRSGEPLAGIRRRTRALELRQRVERCGNASRRCRMQLIGAYYGDRRRRFEPAAPVEPRAGHDHLLEQVSVRCLPGNVLRERSEAAR